jgi:hypothetical protein
MRRRDVGRGRRLRPVERIHRAREAASRAYWGPPPSDPTAPYYGGAAERLEADREKAGRVRPERAESSIQAGFRTLRPDRRQERRLEAYRTPNVPERSGRGGPGLPRSFRAPGAPRGRRKAPKNTESFGVPRPSTL